MMKTEIKVLMFGDVVGSLGCATFQKHASRIKEQYQADFLIVNGENCHTTGRGITPRLVNFFKHNGADLVTSGNHIWGAKEILGYWENGDADLVRPANFPSVCPGRGHAVLVKDGVRLGILNLQGRVFMREHLDCPFRAADTALSYLKHHSDAILVDFHAETTSEKMGLAHYLDGRVAGVVGTHTHVQTADERVLPRGTAFITDLGMCGALNGMLGMQIQPVLQNFLTQMPQKFITEQYAPAVVSGVCITINLKTGLASQIERFRVIDDQIKVSESK
jgi:metallophosphoesterase (TIGR00282 family)